MRQAQEEAMALVRMGGVMLLASTPFAVVYVILHFVIKNW